MESLLTCAQVLPAPALLELIDAGLLGGAVAAWMRFPSDDDVVVMAASLVGITMMQVSRSSGGQSSDVDRARRVALSTGFVQESAVMLLRRASSDGVRGAAVTAIAECMRDSDAIKDVVLAAGTIHVIVEILTRALRNRRSSSSSPRVYTVEGRADLQLCPIHQVDPQRWWERCGAQDCNGGCSRTGNA